MKKEYTCYNLQNAECIDDTFGQWSYNENIWCVNTSSILSFLIKQAGTHCKNYASDLFITWRTVETLLTDADAFHGTVYFGIRENGVDHLQFILNRLNHGFKPEGYIGGIYAIDFISEDDGFCTMKLFKVNVID